MKRIKHFAVIAFLSQLNITNTVAQTQIGTDIDGEAGDFSGVSVSMPDAHTVAVGAPYSDANGAAAGSLRIYTWDGTNWTQKGADINGETADDQSAHSVSMPDANTIAVGAPYNDGAINDAGHVRIYEWNGTDWTQKGVDLDGEAPGDNAGYSVSMPDANTVAVGAPYSTDSSGIDAGRVKIYEWNGTDWTQKGSNIDGEDAYNNAGFTVCMPDANTVAIGAPNNSDNGYSAGHVRIYEWNGADWVQKGSNIDGEDAYNNAGFAVCMPDANTVAIGAPKTDNSNGVDAGRVNIYEWNGTSWIQKGIGIDGSATNDEFGYSVNMPNANTIAIGAPNNSNTEVEAGQTRIYSWNGSSWEQIGLDINGEAIGDYSGWAVSMPDASTVAIGAPYNESNGTYAGHVRVYTLSTAGVPDFSDEVIHLSVFPNPSTGLFTLQYNSENTVSYTVADITGKVILHGLLSEGEETIDLRQQEGGVFSLIVNEQVIRLVKE